MITDIQLPEMLRQGVDPESPEIIRLAFARGEVPMGAPERLGVLTFLAFDASDNVKNAALKAFVELEDEFIEKALTSPNINSMSLDLLLSNRPCNEEIKQLVATHPNLSEKLIRRFALTSNSKLLDAVAQNQRALTRWPEAAKELLDNPALELAIKGRLASLLTPEAQEPEPTTKEPPAAQPVEQPATQPAASEPATPEKTEATAAGAKSEPDEDELFAEMAEAMENMELDDASLEEMPEELLHDMHVESDGKNITQLIQSMSIGEKIKLATLGSKSARRLLARDTNRLVATAVIRSPKIQEDEVVLFAQDKTTPDDVLQYILIKKEWLKNYQIRLGLCQNPKTPMPRALRLLETLQERDLRTISKSKNVPSVISSTAVRILVRRHKN
jgi:hypothetical protein